MSQHDLSVKEKKSPLIQVIEHLNNNDVDAALELVHPEFVYEDLALKHSTRGIDGIREQIEGWDVSNFKQTILNVIDTGDKIAIEGIMKGIHKDPFPIGDEVYEPTGKTVEFRFCTVATIRDGKLASEVHYYNVDDLRAQLR